MRDILSMSDILDPSHSMHEEISLKDRFAAATILIEAAREAGLEVRFPLLSGSANAGKTAAAAGSLAAAMKAGQFVIIDEVDPATTSALIAKMMAQINGGSTMTDSRGEPVKIAPAITFFLSPEPPATTKNPAPDAGSESLGDFLIRRLRAAMAEATEVRPSGKGLDVEDLTPGTRAFLRRLDAVATTPPSSKRGPRRPGGSGP